MADECSYVWLVNHTYKGKTKTIAVIEARPLDIIEDAPGASLNDVKQYFSEFFDVHRSDWFSQGHRYYLYLPPGGDYIMVQKSAVQKQSWCAPEAKQRSG